MEKVALDLHFEFSAITHMLSSFSVPLEASFKLINTEMM